MWSRLRFAILILIAAPCAAMPLLAQEVRPAQPDPDKPTHGIIRKARPRSAEPVKHAPVATTDAAAAAIAAAVQSAGETKRAAPPRPRPARPVEPRAALRRYEVRWPSRRLEVAWATHNERVTLSWQDAVPAEPERNDSSLEP